MIRHVDNNTSVEPATVIRRAYRAHFGSLTKHFIIRHCIIEAAATQQNQYTPTSTVNNLF